MSLMLAVALSAAVVGVSPLVVRWAGGAAGWVLGAALLVPAAGLAWQGLGPGGVREESVPWLPALEVTLRLRLDGLSLLFSLLVLVVGALVMVYSASYVSDRRAGFYALMTAFAAAMLVLVLADDLVVLFVSWELTTLCSYLLILRSGPDAKAPATRTLLVTAAGGLCLLGAVGLIWARTGTTVLSDALVHPAWGSDAGFASAVAVLVALAAMTKSAQFPFHSWLPDAMVAPAPVSAYLHAAAMVKAGIFLLMRFAPATSQAAVWPVLLLTVGLVTAVMGALFALQRTDLKELLAYSTVSQLGLLVAVIGVGTPYAMLAASAHVVAHAMFKAAGFMTVGMLEKRTGTRDIRELRGLARAMPWSAAMLTLAAVSMAGLPPLLGFVSKELLLEGLLEAGSVLGWVAAVVAALGAVLTVAYSLRMLATTLPGPADAVGVERGGHSMVLAISVVALGGLVGGVAGGTFAPVVRPAAAVAAAAPLGEIGGLYLWPGITAPLVLSALAIAVGVAVTLGRVRVDAALDRSLFPGTGVAAAQAVQDGAAAAGRRVANLTRYDAPAAHLLGPTLLLAASSTGVLWLWRGLPDTGPFEVLDLFLLGLLLSGAVIVVRARQRLTAVVAAGVAGFAVALWFFHLGASDVALTQLLVEILTVVVMVLVLRRMGPRFSPTPRRRQLSTGVVALGAGLAATLATLVFTGHRGLSRVGEWYLTRTYEATGATNVVNSILVDFRALDTLGELVVLAVAAVSVSALLHARRLTDAPSSGRLVRREAPLVDPVRNSVFLRVIDRVLVPVMLVASAYALLRGHSAPGGGFIAALIGVSALGLAYLSAPEDDAPRVRRPFLAIAGGGVVVAVLSGLAGYVEGSFLRPIDLVEVLGLKITTALVFDLGVYLAVFGVILAAINLLGTPRSEGSTP